ncbi:hypothetical protein WJX77_000278 [Trebouxia sp. C0004]
MFDDRRKIGVGLTAFGLLFTFLGVLFFFDRGLLAMGNLLFLAGVATTIGPRATLRFFMRRKNLKGSVCFLVGVTLILVNTWVPEAITSVGACSGPSRIEIGIKIAQQQG